MGIGKFVRKLTRIADPLDLVGKTADKIGGESFGTLVREGPLGNADNIKELAGSKFGSVLSGRFIVQRGIYKQDMETARTFDVFGSPATAGTKQQTTARAAAVIYGAAVAGGAALASSGSGTAGTAAAGGGVAGGSGGAVTLAGTTVPVATGTAATWGGTLASIGKYAALGLTLGRQFGVLPAGPGSPEYAPAGDPGANYLPGNLLDSIYQNIPESGYGPGIAAYGDEESGMFSGASSMLWYAIAGAVLLVLIAVFLTRK